jgi:hypothetical protein
MAKTLIGIFPDTTGANRAVDALLHYGYRTDEVSVISKHGEKFEYAHPQGENFYGRTGLSKFFSGAIIGLVIGLLAGFVAYFILSLPNTGFTVRLTTEAIASILVIGAVVGAILGGLIGFSGRKQTNKNYWYESIKATGQIVLAIPSSDSEEPDVKQILSQYGANTVQVIDMNDYIEFDSAGKEAAPSPLMRLAGIKGGHRRHLREKSVAEEAGQDPRDQDHPQL